MLAKASALSRLRYWLHLVQAPKYRPGFVAAERRCPSVRTGYSCSVQAVAERPRLISSPSLLCGAAGNGLAFRPRSPPQLDAPHRGAYALSATRDGGEDGYDGGVVVRQNKNTIRFSAGCATGSTRSKRPSTEGVSSPLKNNGVPQCDQCTLLRKPCL